MPLTERAKERILFAADTLTPGPFHCFLCHEEDRIGEDGLCDACRESLSFLPNPTWLSPLDGATVGLRYSKAISSAILRFKKGGQTEYARFFAQYLSVPEEWHADLLIPVPMHPFKQMIRGFNHSALLCAYLSHATGIPYSLKLLHKVRLTAEQKGQTNADDRRRNIRGSFEADPLVKGCRIVLVDDVFTTGATVYECAKVLKQKGASRVYLAAITSPDR